MQNGATTLQTVARVGFDLLHGGLRPDMVLWNTHSSKCMDVEVVPEGTTPLCSSERRLRNVLANAANQYRVAASLQDLQQNTLGL